MQIQDSHGFAYHCDSLIRRIRRGVFLRENANPANPKIRRTLKTTNLKKNLFFFTNELNTPPPELVTLKIISGLFSMK